MKKIARIITGYLVISGGAGLFIFDILLLKANFTWATATACLVLFGLGMGLINLGIAVARGHGLRDALFLLLFLGNRTP